MKNFKKITNSLRFLVLMIIATSTSYAFLVNNIPSALAQENNQDETADWQVFRSETEGFTLKYPNDWVLKNTSEGNCGKIELNGSKCRERFEFIAPDGVRIRYVQHEYYKSNDKILCGPGNQGPCGLDTVLGLKKLNIEPLGEVYLVALDNKKVALHQPLSADTVPVFGENKHDNFDINYRLSSKFGGNISLFITPYAGINETTEAEKLSTEDYYKLESVKQGILVLKSLNYY